MTKKTGVTFPDDDDDDRERHLRWVFGEGRSMNDGSAKPQGDGLPCFRPRLRPPIPIVTVLDDGSCNAGEDVRLRQESFTIGRTFGDLRIPNDLEMSDVHAEIRRSQAAAGYQWHLHDLDTVDGTFVRCVRAVLREEATLILGSRRFQLRHGPEPTHVDAPHGSPSPRPILTEVSPEPGAMAFPLESETLVIGRPGGGADLVIDDLLLEQRHAALTRMEDGTWMIKAEASRNGIWVSIPRVIALSSQCHFRCGEQLFRFVIP